MFHMKNGLNNRNISYTGSHKFSDILWPMGGEFLMHTVTNLYWTIYNKINIFPSDVQKRVLYTGSHKRFLVYYGLHWKWLEMHFKSCFMVCFYLLNFNTLCDMYTVQRH